jgi:hypothetical protein
VRESGIDMAKIGKFFAEIKSPIWRVPASQNGSLEDMVQSAQTIPSLGIWPRCANSLTWDGFGV